MALKTFVDGEILYAADVNEYLVNSRLARCTADFAISATETFFDVPGLELNVSAGVTYHVLVGLFLRHETTANAQVKFLGPAGATMNSGCAEPDGSNFGDSEQAIFVRPLALGATLDTTGAGSSNFPLTLVRSAPLYLSGILVVGVTSGTFKVQIAQPTFNSNALRALKDSFIWLRRVE